MDERTEKLKEDLHQELLEVKVCIVSRRSTSHLQLTSRSTYIWGSVFESIVPNNVKFFEHLFIRRLSRPKVGLATRKIAE